MYLGWLWREKASFMPGSGQNHCAIRHIRKCESVAIDVSHVMRNEVRKKDEVDEEKQRCVEEE
jgi:hypothetical protein